ncbi:MAG: hypothetical protein KJ732_01575 [Candidatus Margulisbacteria bacterium]|nr:hypothetical protein [Candidatus Margulisiibacteriota bacterium]
MDFNIYTFSTLSASATNLLLACIVFLHNPTKRRNIVYSVFCLFVAVWAFSCFLQTITKSYDFALLSDYLLFSFAIFTPALFADFINTYTNNISKKVLLLFYLCSFVLFISNFTPFFRIGVSNQIGFRYVAVPYFGWYLFNIFYAICATLGLFKLYVSMKENKGALQMQLIYLFLAFIILVTGGTFYLLFSFSIKTPPIDNLFNVISGIIITYTITKHELMDIRMVISRSVAYGIIGISLVSSFILLNLTPMNLILQIAVNSALGLFWAFAAHRLREFIQTPLEEKWITGWYDPNKLVNNIAQKLVPVLEKEKAFEVITDELKRTIKIKKVESLPASKASSTNDIAQTKEGLIIPLNSSEGPEGAILLGPKISEDPYDQKDITLFRTIMAMTIAVFDRIRPYEKIKREFEENQQKLFEAERQLERAQHLSSLGRIISEVAHEIRNPLAVIVSRAKRIKDEPDCPAKIKESAELISDRSDQIEKVVGTMRTLSQTPKYEPKEVNIAEPIESALRFMPFRKDIRIIKDLNPAPPIMGDRDELERVFINLFTNAYDAMIEKGGKLAIRLQPQNGHVKIEIEDTGSGISKENLPKIFEPFYTTKFGKVKERMGFGLSICHNIIVKNHGGTLTAESIPEKGTTFTITLPAKAK